MTHKIVFVACLLLTVLPGYSQVIQKNSALPAQAKCNKMLTYIDCQYIGRWSLVHLMI